MCRVQIDSTPPTDQTTGPIFSFFGCYRFLLYTRCITGTSVYQVNTHLRFAHGIVKVAKAKCPECDHFFKSNSEMNRHVKKIHRGEKTLLHSRREEVWTRSGARWDGSVDVRSIDVTRFKRFRVHHLPLKLTLWENVRFNDWTKFTGMIRIFHRRKISNFLKHWRG